MGEEDKWLKKKKKKEIDKFIFCLIQLHLKKKKKRERKLQLPEPEVRTIVRNTVKLSPWKYKCNFYEMYKLLNLKHSNRLIKRIERYKNVSNYI